MRAKGLLNKLKHPEEEEGLWFVFDRNEEVTRRNDRWLTPLKCECTKFLAIVMLFCVVGSEGEAHHDSSIFTTGIGWPRVFIIMSHHTKPGRLLTTHQTLILWIITCGAGLGRGMIEKEVKKHLHNTKFSSYMEVIVRVIEDINKDRLIRAFSRFWTPSPLTSSPSCNLLPASPHKPSIPKQVSIITPRLRQRDMTDVQQRNVL
ncbi:hypothetical protein ACTXT7_001987 [Hymenolepis weldensis]